MKLLILVPILALLPITGCATEAIPFGHTAPWEERQYKTTLPAPFGVVQITIEADSFGETTSFFIKTDAGEVALPKDMLEQISDVSAPQVTYGEAGKATPAKIDTFAVHIEFGELVYSEKYLESFKKIAGWNVDESMTIRDFEVVEFQ